MKMNKFTFVIFFAIFTAIVYTNCETDTETEVFLESPYIEGLTIDNFPRMDGSTSTYPLSAIIACTLFDIDYKWVQDRNNIWDVEPQVKGNLKKKFNALIKSSQTHNSFINLITGDTDLILSARTMSDHEITYAQEAGVTLIETPFALDAFIFIVHPYNPVESLTIKQIQDIYMGEITHWNEVGWDFWKITPYIRNSNSGSQELMESLVMKDLDADLWYEISDEYEIIGSMIPTYERVSSDHTAICYSVYYFKEYIIKRGNYTKTIAINGIAPNKETIGNNSYPLTAEVYAVIGSDTDTASMTYKVYEWLRSEAGKQAISESGYVPIN